MINSWRDDPRATTNPIFNHNRLKLGVFGLNGIGICMTKVPEAMNGDWDASVTAAINADLQGFEAIVPYARWKGYIEDDPFHKSSIAHDCYTWAAGTAQATRKCSVFATSHVPTIHPLLAAKQCATIDHIAHGRFSLNVVAGWNKPELDMFGVEMRAHDERYDQAAEWITLLRRLWTEDREFDHEGRYYKLTKAVSLPRPKQQPFPAIMNAGGSGRGRAFAAKYSDMAFVLVASNELDAIKAEVDSIRRLARDEYSREIQVWTCCYVVERPTDLEAQQYLHYYAEEFGDERSLDGWMRLHSAHTKMLDPEVHRRLRFRFKAGNGGIELVGTSERIVDKLQTLSAAGVDGVLLSWVDYLDGLRRWKDGVGPMLVEAGLRS